MPTERSRRAKRPTQAPLAAESVAKKDERWWIIVVSSAPELGSGRYGVWEEKPVVRITDDGNTAVVNARNGHNDDEATVYVNLRDTLTISVGKIEHFDAQPIGKLVSSNASPNVPQG